MDYLENTTLFSAFWMIKAICLDIENCLSRIDYFLQSVPKFLSIITNSSEARGELPIHRDRCSELVEKINISEINLVMSRLGVGWAMEDPGNENGNKPFYVEDDFLTLFDEEEPSFEEIKETFEVFDSNKDGFIDCGDLRRVLCALGFRQGCDLEDCKRMIRVFDVNGDGLIDFREFVMFMEKCFSNA
ncbi:probable calcium-binding protein CML46 [Henckelia pumila]|uniref:probable calcium-binding protein CML46 n=1 Tax=Henckelia pumila TaxID=405737 RepID=UPI003C6E3313